MNLCVCVLNTIVIKNEYNTTTNKNPPMWMKMPLIRSGSQEVLCCASYRENSINLKTTYNI